MEIGQEPMKLPYFGVFYHPAKAALFLRHHLGTRF